MTTRKKFSISILTYLLPSLEKIAVRNKWDLDVVIEEAFIHYLNSENIYVPYTKDTNKKARKDLVKINNKHK